MFHTLGYFRQTDVASVLKSKDPPYYYLIPFTDWAHNAHSVPFEQSKNAQYVPSL